MQSNGTPSAPGSCDSLDCDSLSALSVGVGDVEDDRDGLLYSVSSALERFVVTVVYMVLQLWVNQEVEEKCGVIARPDVLLWE